MTPVTFSVIVLVSLSFLSKSPAGTIPVSCCWFNSGFATNLQLRSDSSADYRQENMSVK